VGTQVGHARTRQASPGNFRLWCKPRGETPSWSNVRAPLVNRRFISRTRIGTTVRKLPITAVPYENRLETRHDRSCKSHRGIHGTFSCP